MSKPHPFFATVLTAFLVLAATVGAAFGQAPFSQLVVFGDSLSDTGNVANVTDGDFGLRYPGDNFNYDNGRFTNGPNSNPAEVAYDGVWHEQLVRVFFDLPRARPSTDGGLNYAYGGATTKDGTKDITVVSNPTPFGGGRFSITVRNMGQQVSDFLRRSPLPDPAVLYIVWGGGNDLFNDASASNVSDAAGRIPALVERLARAGAVNFLVPNVPPLGAVPNYRDDPGAAARLNAASAEFRDQLNANLDELQARLTAEGVPFQLYRLDIYELFLNFAHNPAAYGFRNIVNGAQGENVPAESYLFWDNIHPTTAGHFQLAAEAYTLLTGVPVVQLAPAKTDINLKTGEKGIFFLTRTGLDLSKSLPVQYTVGGGAVPGVNYNELPGSKNLGVDRRTTKIKVLTIPAPPGEPNRAIQLMLAPPPEGGPDYRLPVILTQKINLRTDR